MYGINNCVFLGFLGRDPEVKYVGDDRRPVCNLSLGCSYPVKNKDGSYGEAVEWVQVAVWGKQGEACGKHLAKGSGLSIVGHLKTDKWEEDGKNRYSSKIVAEKVVFLPRRDGSITGTGSSKQAQQAAPGAPPIDDDDIPF